jgi:hypothetical protein
VGRRQRFNDQELLAVGAIGEGDRGEYVGSVGTMFTDADAYAGKAVGDI